MTYEEIMAELKSLEDADAIEGMARFGIAKGKAFGVSMPVLRKMGKKIGTDHELAAQLWDSGYREARILAGIVEDPAAVTVAQLESWMSEFDSWEIVDQFCMNLFSRMEDPYERIKQWSGREEEFIKRAGYSLMAVMAVRDKKAGNKVFESMLPYIVEGSEDARNMVKKSVNWALRSIGKRNAALNGKAIRTAEKIKKIDKKCARWIASDALRELQGEKVRERLKKRK